MKKNICVTSIMKQNRRQVRVYWIGVSRCRVTLGESLLLNRFTERVRELVTHILEY